MADTTMVEMVQQTITAQTEQANALADKIAAQTTDKGKLVHEIRTDENTSDATVKSHQEWFEKANAAIEAEVAKINAYISENLLPKSEDFDVEAAKEQYKELKTAIQAATKFVAMVPGYDAETFKVPDLKNLRGGTSGSGGGGGGKRPRLERIWVNGEEISKETEKKDGTVVSVSNFTLAAQYISKAVGSKVQVSDLQAAAFAEAKTDDLSTLNGAVFEYVFSAGEGDKAKNFTVKVQPKVKDDSSEAEAETETTPEAETVAAE